MAPFRLFPSPLRRDLVNDQPCKAYSSSVSSTCDISDAYSDDSDVDAGTDSHPPSPPFFDAPTSFFASHQRRGSWTSGSTDFTSDAGESEAERSLEDLGLGAAELLEQLEVERAMAAQKIPPRRTRQSSPRNRSEGEIGVSPTCSPVAGPSLYQKTRRPTHAPGPAPSLTSSNSMATLRNNPRPVSWTQTQLAELDIDSLLRAYDCSSDSSSCGDEDSYTTPVSKANLTFPAPPSRESLLARSGALPRSSPLFSHITSETVRARPQGAADLPYAELFPISRSSPFPTKKKSTASLRSQAHSDSFRDSSPRPPVPVFPYHLTAPPLSNPNPFPFQRRSVAASSHSSESSPNSQRSSYQSSVLSSESFRWSTTSGSTAPTIAEEDDAWSQSGRSSCSPSKSYLMRRASDASVYSDVDGSKTYPSHREPGSLVNESIDEDVDGDVEVDWDKVLGPRPAARPSMRHPAYRQSGGSLSSSGRSSPLDTGLQRVKSTTSLRRIRSSASLTAPPPIPSRSTSLHRKAKGKGKEKEKESFGIAVKA